MFAHVRLVEQCLECRDSEPTVCDGDKSPSPGRMLCLFAASWRLRTRLLPKPVRAAAPSIGLPNLYATRTSMAHCATATPSSRRPRKINECGHYAAWPMRGEETHQRHWTPTGMRSVWTRLICLRSKGRRKSN